MKNHIFLSVFITGLIFAFGIPFSFAIETDESIIITVQKNPEDATKPIFIWDEIPNAVNYQLYVQNELLYSGSVNRFPPEETFAYDPLAFGYYQVYLMVQLEDGEYIRSGVSDFAVGMEAPQIVKPEDQFQTYSNRIVIEWTGDQEALAYQVSINGEIEYDGPNTTFVFEPGVGEEIYDTYQIRVKTYNNVQSVTSKERVRFEIMRLPAPELKAPNDKWQGVIRITDDIPKLEWEPIEVSDPELTVEYELYVICLSCNQKEEGAIPYYVTEETSVHPNNLKDGDYRWFVKAKIPAQTSPVSEKFLFRLLPPIGLYIGVKGGAGANIPDNPSSDPAMGWDFGFYLEQRILRKSLVHILIGFDLLYDHRRLKFNQESYDRFYLDSPMGLRSDFVMDSRVLTIPILAKAHFVDMPAENMCWYPFIGPQFGFAIYQRLTTVEDNPSTGKPDSYATGSESSIKGFMLDLAVGVGYNITFKDITFFAKRNLQIFVELKWILALVPVARENFFFLGESVRNHQFVLNAGLKIIDF